MTQEPKFYDPMLDSAASAPTSPMTQTQDQARAVEAREKILDVLDAIELVVWSNEGREDNESVEILLGTLRFALTAFDLSRAEVTTRGETIAAQADALKAADAESEAREGALRAIAQRVADGEWSDEGHTALRDLAALTLQVKG